MLNKKNMKIVDVTAVTLAGVGALNWGSVAWFSLNLVDYAGALDIVVYSLVGVSGVYILGKQIMNLLK